MACGPLRSVDRAGTGSDVGASRCWWDVWWCWRPVALDLLGWRWSRELESGHRITQIGDALLQIGPPIDELIDLGCGRLDLGDDLVLGLQGVVEAIEEGLKLRSRLPNAPRLDNLGQSGGEGVGWSGL